MHIHDHAYQMLYLIAMSAEYVAIVKNSMCVVSRVGGIHALTYSKLSSYSYRVATVPWNQSLRVAIYTFTIITINSHLCLLHVSRSI
jgi:hypothetical protein